jgi:precorrin-6B methylase 2
MRIAVFTVTIACLLWTTATAGQQPESRADPSALLPDVVFVPTPHDVVEAMLELVRVQKSDVVYDLGCGDGRIVVAAAKKYGCRAVGCDIDPLRVDASRENVRRNGVEDLVKIELSDVFQADLREATVVTLYLTPRYNERLIPQLEQMKPGSRIVSHMFGLRGIKPERILRLQSKEDGKQHALFLWTTPLKVRNPRQEKTNR